MTLDDIERLARSAAEAEQRDLRDIAECRRLEALNTLTGAARGATETAAGLARAVLAMLPVVRAAESWRDSDNAMEHGDDPAAGARFRDAWDGLNESIDEMRRAMEGK